MIRQERKPRATTLGEFMAVITEYIISTVPGSQRRYYRSRLVEELKRYSFKSRPKGTPRHEGCVYELEGIDLEGFNVPEDPETVARGLKEVAHMMYLKPHARRYLIPLRKKIMRSKV